MEDAPYTVTLKAGSGYDAPWIIVKAESVRQLKLMLDELHSQYAEQNVARSAAALKAAYEHENRAR